MRRRDKPLVIAHRGASADAPENTLAAFRLALSQGAEAIELDVQLTRDQQVVVMHDNNLKRTTGIKAKVSSLTLEEIKKLDAGSWFGDQKFKNERVPTLAEVIDQFAGRVLINIEFKNLWTPFDGLEAHLAALIKKKKVSSRVMVSSFNPLTLRRFKKHLASVPCCASYFPPVHFAGFIKTAKPFEVMGPQYKTIGHSSIKRLHKRGKFVNVWTVDGRQDLENMIKIGADMITTNYPARLVKLLK